MDLSVIAASVGSFVVSERVIRAKASVLAVLASVAAYDVWRHSHDPASLRVYRGPALVAFTMSCVAASLRVWRRNGVACDELLFLPGTPYAAKHGVSCPAADSAAHGKATSSDHGMDMSGGADGPGEEVELVPTDEGATDPRRGAAAAAAGADKLKTSDHSIGLLDDDEDSDSNSDSDDGASRGLLSAASFSVSSGGGGPVIVPLEFDAGPDAAAGMAIRPPQQQQRQQQQRSQQKRRRHRRSLSDTVLAEPTAESSSDGAGGGGGVKGAGGAAGMRSRRNTHDVDLADDERLQREIAAAGFHAEILKSSSEEFGDASLDLLEEGSGGGGGAVDDGGGGGGGGGIGRNDSQSELLLDNNEGLRDESMIRYLLCSRGERLRLRNRRRANLSTAAAEGAVDALPSDKGGVASPMAAAKADAGGRLTAASKKTDAGDSTYSPSGPSVAGAAVDLCLPVLFNFHMFVVLSNSRGGGGGSTAASTAGSSSSSGGEGSSSSSPSSDFDQGMNPRVLPLIFLSILFIRAVVPPKGRMRFWSTIMYTACAPFYAVYFRDAFLGDVMTSLVKPIMDLAYCIFYYFLCVYMIFSVSSTLDDAGQILEKSWALHNLVLPAIAVLPLWWKFLQTLRQAWDSNRRWPHLGNSLKYLSAAMVVLYGMAHPEGRRSWWWVTAFALATLYQIWWDTFMDWELLVVSPRRRGIGGDGSEGGSTPTPTVAETSHVCACAETCGCNCISSIPASSHVLLPLHRYVAQPVADGWRRVRRYLGAHTLTLRPRRLYKREQFYRRVLAYNALSRPLWMLGFIPAYHLGRDGIEVRTLAADAKTYVGAAISVAEIVRRCLWGILKLELETIKVTEYTPVPTEECDDPPPVVLETADERFGGKPQNQSGVDCVLSALRFESQSLMVQSARKSAASAAVGRGRFKFTDAFWRRCFLAELVLWAAAFVGLGVVSVWVL